jgi:hypothetical protein
MNQFPVRRAVVPVVQAALFLVVAACSEQFPKEVPAASPAPAPTPTNTVPGDKVRTVEVRSPFGVNDVEQNLFVDGDFEFTGRSQQMPWLRFNDNGQGVLNYETGGRCRTGIRCAFLKKGDDVIGWVSSPKTGRLNISFYVLPASGVCNTSVEAYFLDIEDQTGAAAIKGPDAPDATGWCKFEASVRAKPNGQTTLYVSTKDTEIRLDSATAVVPSTSGGSMLAPPSIALAVEGPPHAALAARMRFIREWIHTHRHAGIVHEPSLDNPPRKVRN